jgi:hypothetical protein
MSVSVNLEIATAMSVLVDGPWADLGVNQVNVERRNATKRTRTFASIIQWQLCIDSSSSKHRLALKDCRSSTVYMLNKD